MPIPDSGETNRVQRFVNKMRHGDDGIEKIFRQNLTSKPIEQVQAGLNKMLK